MGLIRIDVSPELLAHILENGEHPRGYSVTDGLPAGSKFSHATLDVGGPVSLFYEHPALCLGVVVQLTPRVTVGQ